MGAGESRVPPLVLTRSGNAGRASTLLSACCEIPTLAPYASAMCSLGRRLPVQLCGEYMTVTGGCQVKKRRSLQFSQSPICVALSKDHQGDVRERVRHDRHLRCTPMQ
jgi:hypothetical protein